MRAALSFCVLRDKIWLNREFVQPKQNLVIVIIVYCSGEYMCISAHISYNKCNKCLYNVIPKKFSKKRKCKFVFYFMVMVYNLCPTTDIFTCSMISLSREYHIGYMISLTREYHLGYTKENRTNDSISLGYIISTWLQVYLQVRFYYNSVYKMSYLRKEWYHCN